MSNPQNGAQRVNPVDEMLNAAKAATLLMAGGEKIKELLKQVTALCTEHKIEMFYAAVLPNGAMFDMQGTPADLVWLHEVFEFHYRGHMNGVIGGIPKLKGAPEAPLGA